MRRDNLLGSLWMTLSMLGFALEDGFLKSAAGALPLGQVLITQGLFGIAVFALVARAAGQPPLPRAILSRTMAIRSGFELAGRLFYALAVALTPISLASAILQATPLVVVLGAAWLFHEKVSLSRWLLIGLGFVGVLIVVNPRLSGFDASALLALTGMLGFAGRDLATRAAPPALSNAQLGAAGFCVLTLAGLILTLVHPSPLILPNLPQTALLAGACLFGVAGYAALTRAMRTGDVSAVTPFRYTRLLFALAVGMLAFGEIPGPQRLIGSALIILAGILLLKPRRIT